MRTHVVVLLLVAGLALAAPARADFFAFDLDAQGGYSRIHQIEMTDDTGTQTATGTVAGPMVGVRGRLQILFLQAIVDYQHFISDADYMHAGLGAGVRMDSLPVIDLYVGGSAGLLLLVAKRGAFEEDMPKDLSPTELGFQARAGGGLEFPFLGDWFAIGVGVDVGYHYLTGRSGWDLSVNGHLGLRI